MPESLFDKVRGLRPPTLLKKRLWHRCFPMSFGKFLRTSFLHNYSIVDSRTDFRDWHIEYFGWVRKSYHQLFLIKCSSAKTIIRDLLIRLLSLCFTYLLMLLLPSNKLFMDFWTFNCNSIKGDFWVHPIRYHTETSN